MTWQILLGLFIPSDWKICAASFVNQRNKEMNTHRYRPRLSLLSLYIAEISLEILTCYENRRKAIRQTQSYVNQRQRTLPMTCTIITETRFNRLVYIRMMNVSNVSIFKTRTSAWRLCLRCTIPSAGRSRKTSLLQVVNEFLH